MDVETRSIAATMCLILALNVGDVHAQQAKTEDVNSSDNGAEIKTTSNKKATILEEVFVTATKRSKSLRSLPASISAFKGEDDGWISRKTIRHADDFFPTAHRRRPHGLLT